MRVLFRPSSDERVGGRVRRRRRNGADAVRTPGRERRSRRRRARGRRNVALAIADWEIRRTRVASTRASRGGFESDVARDTLRRSLAIAVAERAATDSRWNDGVVIVGVASATSETSREPIRRAVGGLHEPELSTNRRAEA